MTDKYPPLPLQDFREAAAKRQEHIAQSLYDALAPFIAAYEKDAIMQDRFLPDDQPKYLSVTLGDIRRGQEALKV